MRFKFIFLILSLVILSCSKVEGDEVKIISHAGDGLSFLGSTNASNSLESIEFILAIDGCDGVELDVHLSADGELWLFHDQNMYAAAGIDACINDLSYEELKDARYQTINKEKVVRISDIDFSKFNNKEFYFDIRNANECKGEIIDVNLMVQAFQNLNLPDNNTYYHMTTNKDWLPEFIGAGFNTYFIGPIESINEIVDTPGLLGVETKYEELGDFNISVWQSKVEVGIYGLRAAKSLRKALKMKPDFIETDDVKTAINIKK